MQISVRSHLIAGTAAVVGAAALLAPVTSGNVVMPGIAAPVSARVALAAWTNPVAELLGTVQIAVNYGFGAYYNGGDSPTPGAGEANWPYAGFDQPGGDFLNYALYNSAELGFYSFVGEAPQNVNDAMPIIRRLETNVSGYVNTGLTGLVGAGLALSNGAWNFPSALATAAQLVIAGQISQALTVLTDAVVAPIQAAASSLISAGTTIVSNIAARLGAVVAALPQIVTTFAGAAAGSAALTAQAVTQIGQSVVSNLLALNFQGAWNAAVAGYLGPSGLPGLALNLLAGAGIQTGPIATQADIPTNFVPSLRTATQAAVWSVASALSTSVAPAAAVAAAGPRSAAAAGRSAVKPAAAKSAASPRAARSVKAAASAKAAG